MDQGGRPIPMLEQTDDQVVELVKQLPPERQRAALLALPAGAAQQRADRQWQLEAQRGSNR
jgi:hypothetical protein